MSQHSLCTVSHLWLYWFFIYFCRVVKCNNDIGLRYYHFGILRHLLALKFQQHVHNIKSTGKVTYQAGGPDWRGVIDLEIKRRGEQSLWCGIFHRENRVSLATSQTNQRTIKIQQYVNCCAVRHVAYIAIFRYYATRFAFMSMKMSNPAIQHIWSFFEWQELECLSGNKVKHFTERYNTQKDVSVMVV